MNSMSTIDESIQQLHETTTQHQTAINTIQATLAYHQTILNSQQNDIADIKTTIVDIRTSINTIIHSLSEITTKLDLQITLPPPLPLSPAPLTPLSTAVAVSTTPLPFSHSSTLHCLPSSPSTPSPASKTSTISLSLSTTMTPTNSSAASIPNALSSIPFPCAPAAFTPPSSALTWFTTIIKPFFLKIQVVAITVDNDGHPHLAKLLSNPNATISYSQILGERKPLIFNPGGKTELESLFVVRFMNCETQLDHNLSVLTSTPLPPTYDLEDKVDFEGMVMIRLNQMIATQPRHITITPATRPKRITKLHMKLLDYSGDEYTTFIFPL